MGNAQVLQTAPEYGTDYVSPYTEKPPYYTTKPDGKGIIRYAKLGPASKDKAGVLKGVEAMTLTSMLKLAVERFGDKPALAYEDLPPLKKDEHPPAALPIDQWTKITYKEYYEMVKKAAKAMIKLGHKKYDACNCFGFNSPEWFITQMAVICAGGRIAGIYPSDTSEQFHFKSDHSNGSIACCDSESTFKKIAAAAPELPYLKAVVYWGIKRKIEDIKRSDGSVVKLFEWAEFLKLGEDSSLDLELETRIKEQDPAQCCALIYTSGTTGNPKAVMCSHDNILFESHNVDCNLVQGWGLVDGYQERIISYLPLSHIAGMLVDIVNPISTTAFTRSYCTVFFARSYDLKLGTLGDRLRAVQPTLFFGVPRVYEKIAEKIKAVGAKTTGLKRKIADWAKSKAAEHQKACQLGGDGYRPWFYTIAEKLLVNKIKQTLGLDQCKVCMTAAAPMTLETLEFFGALGININEIYGMSECTGATTWSTDACHQWGTVGYTLPGTEIKILRSETGDINKTVEAPRCADIFNASEDEQGEICFRGRHIMLGYMANPKLGQEHVKEIEEKNAQAIDKNGWLHSGDKGCMSKSGMIKITGRYKELIIGAGGENIAPVPVEDGIKKRCNVVSNVIMIGDKRKFNVALVTLKAKGATGELPGSDDLDGPALLVNPDVKTISAAMDDKSMISLVQKAIEETNKDGRACPSTAAMVQKFMILPRDFSVETGELTATLKLKRSFVTDKYAKQVDAIYASKDTYVKYKA